MSRNLKKRKKSNLLFITEFFPISENIDIYGGVEMRTYLIARELAKYQRVTVITSRVGMKTKRFNIGNIQVIPAGFQRKYVHKSDYFKRIFFILDSLRKSLSVSYDLVEGAGISSYLTAFISGIIKRKPIVAFVPDTFTSLTYLSKGESVILSVFEKTMLKAPWSGYIVISQVVKNKLLDIVGKKRNIKVIYCPFNSTDLGKVKKTLQPSVVFVGRLVNYKRVDDLIKAIKLVSKVTPDVTCYIVGSGPEEDRLKSLSDRLNLNRTVCFIGHVKSHKRVFTYQSKSWVYCFPSAYEGFGITTIEAMYAKTPFVLPDTRLNKEITKKQGGFFYKPEEVADIANKINFIFNLNKQERNKLTQKNSLVYDKYLPKTITRQTEEFYTSLS